MQNDRMALLIKEGGGTVTMRNIDITSGRVDYVVFGYSQDAVDWARKTKSPHPSAVNQVRKMMANDLVITHEVCDANIVNSLFVNVFCSSC